MEEKENVTTRGTGIKWGMISGLIGIILFVVIDMIGMAGDSKVGFVSMAISIIIIILAHREFVKTGDGFMNYGEGIGIAFWSGSIGGLISSVFSYIYITMVNPNFLEVLKEKQIMDMEKRGMSEAQIEQAMEFSKMFSGAEAIAIFGLLGAIIGSVIFALIIAAFTKKTRPEFE